MLEVAGRQWCVRLRRALLIAPDLLFTLLILTAKQEANILET